MIIANSISNPKLNLVSALPEISFSTAFEFDGVNERIQSPIDVLDITGAMSIELTMKTTSADSLNCHVCKDTTAGAERSWNLTWRGSGAGLRQLFVFFWNTNGTLNSHASTANILDDGAWHHVVWTYDGTAGANGSKLYIDGVLDTQLTASSTGIRNYTGANSDISIGSTSGPLGGWFNKGRINRTNIWDGVVLTPQNVADLYNGIETAQTLSATLMPYFDAATHNGTNWIIPEFNETFNWTSEFMESGDRYIDAP